MNYSTPFSFLSAFIAVEFVTARCIIFFINFLFFEMYYMVRIPEKATKNDQFLFSSK